MGLLGGGQRCHCFSITQHHNTLRYLQHLFQTMADVQHRHACAFPGAYALEQQISVVTGQSGSGFIQNQHRGALHPATQQRQVKALCRGVTENQLI